ncbi:MAG: glycosyltransferase family 2 protein [Hyphomicrobium sp.]|nr:glycosyltransferase family 2 protein [Hyphomicrobium sp.]
MELTAFGARYAGMNHVGLKLMSCVICAYDEEARIGEVLRVAVQHPLIGEIIVVDDGSRDETAERVQRFATVKLLRNETNRGKSYSLARGIGAARFEYIILLDADLAGLEGKHLDALALPVIDEVADVTISMRGDSFYRLIGVDFFVSGEARVATPLPPMTLSNWRRTSRWGERFLLMNDHRARDARANNRLEIGQPRGKGK